jgi:hypothetical protein
MTTRQIPSNFETFAQIGAMLNTYLSISTFFEIFDIPSQNNKWNQLVKCQVNHINDPLLDIDRAYELLEEQDYKCKYCNSDLTLDRQPFIKKEIKNYKFLGMKNIQIQFYWYCKNCDPEIHPFLPYLTETFEQKIERFTHEEYVDNSINTLSHCDEKI